MFVTDKVPPSLLKATELFSRSREEFLKELAGSCRSVKLRNGQILFKSGTRTEGFYLLVSGLIKLFRANSGGESLVRFVRPGETFAEAAIFEESRIYPLSAAACAKSDLIFIPAEPLIERMKSDWNITSDILRSLSIRLKSHVEIIELLSCRNPRTKLAHYLIHVTKSLPTQSSGWTETHLELKRKEVAQAIGVTPETMSRLMKLFVRKKLVNLGPRHILSINRTELESFLEENLIETANEKRVTAIAPAQTR